MYALTSPPHPRQQSALEVEVEVSGPCPAEWRLGQPIAGELSATTSEGEVRRRLDRRRRVHFPPGARRVGYTVSKRSVPLVLTSITVIGASASVREN